MAKKTYSKKTLETKAKDVFKNYPRATKVYAAVDGNIFLNENRAQLHVGSEGTYYTFEREIEPEDDAPTDTNKKISAKDAIELIENAVTTEELEALGFQDDSRTTVKEAYAKKLEQLTAANNN